MNKHFNLIKADLYRLRKEKSFYVILAIIVILNVANYVLNGLVYDFSEVILASAVATDAIVYFFGDGLFVTLLIVEIALFSTTDFKHNTIRNKIIAGNSKRKIYFSCLAVNLIIMIIYSVVMLVISVMACAIWMDFPDVGALLVPVFALMLQYVAIVSIITMIAFIVRSRTSCVVISLLANFLSTIIIILLALFALNSEVVIDILCLNPYTMLTLIVNEFSLMTNAVLSLTTILESICVCIGYLVSFSIIGYLVFCELDIK